MDNECARLRWGSVAFCPDGLLPVIGAITPGARVEGAEGNFVEAGFAQRTRRDARYLCCVGGVTRAGS